MRKTGRHTFVIDGNYFLFRTLYVLPRKSKKAEMLGTEELLKIKEAILKILINIQEVLGYCQQPSSKNFIYFFRLYVLLFKEFYKTLSLIFFCVQFFISIRAS